MFDFFKKKDKVEKPVVTEVAIAAPVNGQAIPINQVEDPVFAQKMMGDGFAVEPTDNKVYAPCEGDVINVFPTKHAIGIKLDNGVEVLVHIGLDTVSLNGAPFDTVVKEGQRVTTSTLLATVDFDAIREAGKGTSVVVVFTNMEIVESLVVETGQEVTAQDVIGKVVTK